MKAPRVTANTPPSEWPNWMTLREVAIVSGRSYRYLGKRCSAGLMWPPPISDEHGVVKPLRFDRDQVLQVMQGKLSRPRRLALAQAKNAAHRRRRTAA